jgi:hypothetical protein
VPATAGFAIMVTWWLGAPAGLTAPLWHRWLPGDAYTIGNLLVDGGGSAQVAVDVGVGVVFLVTLVPVVRGLAVLDASVASMLTRADEPPDTPVSRGPRPPSSGRGLGGLRRRVALAGGRFEASGGEDGSFRLVARFPKRTGS